MRLDPSSNRRVEGNEARADPNPIRAELGSVDNGPVRVSNRTLLGGLTPRAQATTGSA